MLLYYVLLWHAVTMTALGSSAALWAVQHCCPSVIAQWYQQVSTRQQTEKATI